MPIKRSKKGQKTIKKNHPTKKEESAYAKIKREREEKEAQEEKARKQAEKDAKAEKKRKEAIIFPYLDKLMKKLKDTIGNGYWFFIEKDRIKRIKESTVEMKEILMNNSKKYAGKYIGKFTVYTYHKDPSDADYRSWGVYMGSQIGIFKVDKDGSIMSTGSWGCHFRWETDDFKLTKFSLKLIERLALALFETRMSCASITGMSISWVLQQLEKKGYDFSDVLSPLAKV
jgi:hypothetical protein